jgi:glycosyltransferase involved in cell wall biosynthesis
MRVLFQNRVDYASAIAGDGIQMMKTREYLLKAGIEVTIDNTEALKLTEFDVVHLFNIIPVTKTYRYFQNARRQNKPIVLSPIYWDPHEFLEVTNESAKFGAWWRETMVQRREILNGVRLILPNSRMELENLNKTFVGLPPAQIIPNAADKSFGLATPDRFLKKYRLADFLLSVGRICRRKNQLSLIKVAKQLKLQLVIIGPINDTIYYQECRRESAGHHVIYIDTLNPAELASAYAAARVHALVSWYDTPGLVSLEAALAGCVIVSTNRGCAREYFKNLAFYCEPGDLASIREAVQYAWKTPKSNDLKEQILQKFTWEKTASATSEAYQSIVRL